MTQLNLAPAWHEDRVVFDDLEIGEIALDLDDQDPQDVVEWALETFNDRIAIVTALQADGMAVLDMAAKIKPDIRVITVDTGRLPVETYDFIEEVRAHYPKSQWDVLSPDNSEVEAMVARRGVNLFRNSVEERMLCCQIRKVRPLVKALQGVDAWFTGLRRDQWASRAAIQKVQLDHDHEGIVKVNALADWEGDEVTAYNEENGVPVHPLYAKGYTSFGCAPCTRPIQIGENDRAGRWWWETGAPKECGIHCPIETGSFEHEAEAIFAEAERKHQQ
ncbi:MAG TPA: phosphoadenylyl-sulfate reductase [Jatrophihabitantaceae bacterium]|nr:phosphoadenylyl-sulfate reductase [Jatrophihabitantaceae bacterium]